MMRIRYLGPSPHVLLVPYGPHKQGEIKDYPDDFGEELLATSKKQKFELVGAYEQEPQSGPKVEDVKELSGEDMVNMPETRPEPQPMANPPKPVANKIKEDFDPLSYKARNKRKR